MRGRIHSFQSLGTVDGPGVRFVVFLQGCHLRCACCHNPDTHDRLGGVEYTPAQVLERVLRYREYFGKNGGITVSGGEPLLQAAFCRELFALCREAGIHTCLDTSGSILLEETEALLALTDYVLLDVKYTEEELYRRHVGCSLAPVLRFLERLQELGIPTTLRQVIIPSVNDGEGNVLCLKELARSHSCVQRVELLPFKKICQVKYDSMGLSFPFGHLPEPSAETMRRLRALL